MYALIYTLLSREVRFTQNATSVKHRRASARGTQSLEQLCEWVKQGTTRCRSDLGRLKLLLLLWLLLLLLHLLRWLLLNSLWCLPLCLCLGGAVHLVKWRNGGFECIDVLAEDLRSRITCVSYHLHTLPPLSSFPHVSRA